MATARSPELARATAVFLLAVAGALQTLAGALAFPDWLFLSLLGLAAPIMLARLVLGVQAPGAARLLSFLAELFALLALAAVVFAVLSPSTAGGLLVVLWLGWLAVLPLCVWVNRARRSSPLSGV